MPFWEKLGRIAKAVYTGVKEAGKVLVQTVVSGVKEALSGIGNSSGPIVGGNKGWTPPKPPKPDTSQEEIKARIREHMRVISQYQQEVENDTKRIETAVQKAYDAAYKDLLQNLKQCGMDVSDIKRFMNTKRSSFAHSMRDEVNTKVSPEYREWKALIDDVNSDSATIRTYTDNVYRNARNNLLEKLEQAFEETNNQISRYVEKFLNDKNQALQIKKESLVNMTKDKDSKMRELQKIVEEYASMAFIQYEAEKEI